MRYVVRGGQWAAFSANDHAYRDGRLALGQVLDRNGVLLYDGASGTWAEDGSIRRATLHAVGDRDDNISTSAKAALRQRLEEEDMPAIRGLLVQDRQHLDSVQTTMASSREFCFVLRRRKTDGAMNYASLEQQFRDCGFVVQRAEDQQLLELLAIYFEQDATHEVFSFVDGAQWLTAETEV